MGCATGRSSPHFALCVAKTQVPKFASLLAKAPSRRTAPKEGQLDFVGPYDEWLDGVSDELASGL